MTETLRRGYPGMKSVKDMPVLQDGPPPGGFPSIRYGRRMATSGPTGVALFAAMTVAFVYGFYQIGLTNQETREWKAEKMLARANVEPVLQAEEDRRWVRQKEMALRVEAELMKNVPGWKVGESVYNTKRWMPPARPIGVWDQ